MNPIYFAFANIFISFIGFVSLFTIWLQVQRKFKAQDQGYLYLSLAILSWLFAPILQLLQFEQPEIDFVSGLSSTLNNGLFLFAMFFFEFAPRRLPFSDSKKAWGWFIGILCGLISGVQIILYRNDFQDPPWGILPDILFSVITLLVISITFFKSFRGRKLNGLAYFFSIVLALVFSTQLFGTWNNWHEQYPGVPSLLRLGLHLSLIILFLSSVLGWVIERGVIPHPKRMKLYFDDVKNEELVVRVTVDEYFENVSVNFTSALYLHFLKFAVRKKYQGAGLKIKDVHAVYHQRIEDRIREYNPIYGKASNRIKNAALARWPFFFEKTSDEYALVVRPENIMISPKLIQHQLDKLKFEGMNDSNRKREIKFIKEEFRNSPT